MWHRLRHKFVTATHRRNNQITNKKQTRRSGLKLLLHRTNQTAFWQIVFNLVAGRSNMDDKVLIQASNFANIPDASAKSSLICMSALSINSGDGLLPSDSHSRLTSVFALFNLTLSRSISDDDTSIFIMNYSLCKPVMHQMRLSH